MAVSKLNVDRLLDQDIQIGDLILAGLEPDNPYSLATVVGITYDHGQLMIECQPYNLIIKSEIIYKVSPQHCRKLK